MFRKELKKWITKQTLVLCNFSPKNKLSVTILLSLSLSHLDRCSHSLRLRRRSKFKLRSKSIYASSTSNLSARQSFSLSSSSFQLRPWTNSLPPPHSDAETHRFKVRTTRESNRYPETGSRPWSSEPCVTCDTSSISTSTSTTSRFGWFS
jgi:hypothetical protein